MKISTNVFIKDVLKSTQENIACDLLFNLSKYIVVTTRENPYPTLAI